MDAIALALAKKYTNEQLRQKDTNFPTRKISFDGGIYSVGSDVVNGQVSDVVLLGNTVSNILPDNTAGCESISEWHVNNTTVAVDSVNALKGTYAIKATLTAGQTNGLASCNITISDKTQYYLATAYIKNGNLSAEGARFELGFDGDVGKSTSYVTGTSYQRVGVVLQPSDLSGINRIEVRLRVRGTENQYGYIDCIMLQAISSAEYALGVNALMQKYNWVLGTKSTNSARVKSVGKNLFDLANTSFTDGKYYNLNGIYYDHAARSVTTSYTPVQPNTQYSVPTFTTSGMYHLFYDENKNLVGYVLGSTSPFTTPANAKFMRFTVVTANKNTFQLEEGTTATEYEPYKESIVNVNLPEPLRSVPSAKDEVNVTTGVKTQRNGTKTNVNSGTVIDYADMATGGQFVAYAADGTSQVGVKGDTLTITAVSLTYQLAEPIVTKLPAQAPLQVFENGTVYVEPMGDPAESTVPSVEMTIPTGTSNKFGVATHDYGGAAADWVLTKNEANCGILIVTNAGGAANIIAPNDMGRFFFVKNDSGYDIVVKSAGAEAGTTIADGNSVIVFNTGD